MICRLPGSILHRIGFTVLSTMPDTAKSWIMQIRILCEKYNLPSPLSLLTSPPSKDEFKKQIKLKIMDWWQTKYRDEASNLKSLKFFKPGYYSLSKPHPIYASCPSSGFETNKAVVQARLLSGRYRTDMLCRHWSDNSDGWCVLCPGLNKQGDESHMLASCDALKDKRTLLLSYM